MELPKLPVAFSQAARKHVVDAEIKASRTFAASPVVLQRISITSRRETANGHLLNQYVMKVLIAFAEEACAMSKDAVAPWYSDGIDREVREFLRKLIIAAQSHYFAHYQLSSMMSIGEISPETWRIVEESAEWKSYQDLLLMVGPQVDAAPPETKVS